MRPESPRAPTDQEFSVAWELFLDLFDDPSFAVAENLIVWLRGEPTHVQALSEALTLWALAGAAIISSRDKASEAVTRLQ